MSKPEPVGQRSNPPDTELTHAQSVPPVQSLFIDVPEIESSIPLRESQYLMPWVVVAHVVSTCQLAGTLLLLDLRRLGVGAMQTPFLFRGTRRGLDGQCDLQHTLK